MPQFPISVSVTTVTHSWMEHLKDEWRPSGATVSTNEQTLSAIRAARDVAKSNGFAGAVPALSPEDFELGFTTCTDDPVLVSARFFTDSDMPKHAHRAVRSIDGIKKLDRQGAPAGLCPYRMQLERPPLTRFDTLPGSHWGNLHWVEWPSQRLLPIMATTNTLAPRIN